jgi:hypothetical protein
VRPEAFLFAAIVYTNNRWINKRNTGKCIRRGPQFFCRRLIWLPPPLCQLRPQGTDSLPLPLRVAKADKNLLNEEITTASVK